VKPALVTIILYSLGPVPEAAIPYNRSLKQKPWRRYGRFHETNTIPQTPYHSRERLFTVLAEHGHQSIQYNLSLSSKHDGANTLYKFRHVYKICPSAMYGKNGKMTLQVFCLDMNPICILLCPIKSYHARTECPTKTESRSPPRLTVRGSPHRLTVRGPPHRLTVKGPPTQVHSKGVPL
jgi:hypothetical protein